MKHLVLLGAGHAHVHVLQGLAKQQPSDMRITLVAPQPEQLYSGMVPGFVAGHYALNQCVIPLDALMARCGAQYLACSATGMDANAQTLHLSNGQTLGYDLLSLNTGGVMDRDKIEATMPGVGAHALFVRPIEAFGKRWPLLAAKALMQPLHLAVIGAGAAGLELAMAASHMLKQPQNAPGSRVTLITGGAPPAQSYPASVQRRVVRALERMRIAVVQDSCSGLTEGQVMMANGDKLICDAALLAIGAQAPAWLVGSGLALDANGFVAVNHFQQSTSHQHVFAVGDVASRVDAPHNRSGGLCRALWPAAAEQPSFSPGDAAPDCVYAAAAHAQPAVLR